MAEQAAVALTPPVDPTTATEPAAQDLNRNAEQSDRDQSSASVPSSPAETNAGHPSVPAAGSQVAETKSSASLGKPSISRKRRGHVDKADFTRIEGWAFDPAKPDEPVVIEVYDGDSLLIRRAADEFRQDLKTAGFGSGEHSYAIKFNDTLLPFARHLIRVKFADTGIDLVGSPIVLQRDDGIMDASGQRFIEALIRQQIAAAKSVEEIDFTAHFLLEQLNDAVNRQQQLATSAGSELHDLDTSGLSGPFREMVTGLLATCPPLTLPTSSNPDVSIIIPVYNKFEYTYRCLASIAANPPQAPFEVIVVDDRSTDVTMLARLVLDNSVNIIRNETNFGFVRGCNRGAAAARGKYLYFLNNDTEVKPGFLDELIWTFRECEGVGIAGSKLLFPNGKLQEVGGIIWRMGDGWNWGRDDDPNNPRYMYMRDADYVSGAALMIDKELFEQLGGFDELYAPAYYEDTDLCFRVREKGKRVVVQPLSQIVHFEGVTSGTDTSGTGAKRYQVINHRKFLNRWMKTLSSHRFNGQYPELEAERLVSKRALFIDDTVPTPDQDAGSNVALEHMRSLQRLGYKVTFVPGDNMAQINPYTADLQRRGIECLYHPYYSSVEDILKRTAVKFDLVYLHRFSNASKYAGLARQFCPNAKLLYNVADLHFLRLERQAAVEKRADLEVKSRDMQRVELAAIGMVDAVIVHSSYEAKILGERLPGASVVLLPWSVPVKNVANDLLDRSGVAFVGGYNHHPNVDAAKLLATEIMPLVVAQKPHVVCHLAGSNMPAEVAQLANSYVRILGWVPSLMDLFSQIRLTVAPLRYGAGVKGKVLDSLAAGIPCIMTPIAAEGIDLPPSLLRLVADSPQAIADLIIELHDDPMELSRLAAECQAFIAERFSPQAVDDIMRAAARS